MHWCVTSAACWIEVLCPADFNPDSLRNREQMCVHTRGEGEKVAEEGRNTSQAIEGDP